MEIATLLSQSPEQTAAIAQDLANKLKGGEVILLNGELGAGKTTLAKALIKALGVTKTVTSPTFTLVKHYKGKFDIYHLDMYRLEQSELAEIGTDDLFSPQSVVIIEWNKLKELIGRVINIDITTVSDTVREFKISGI